MKILVTGASGFVGRSLCEALNSQGFSIRKAHRTNDYQTGSTGHQENITIGEIGLGTNWGAALQDIDCVVHLAARVHVMREESLDPLSEFMRVNTYGTANLAKQAVKKGVKKFIYLSSIKVNGEETELNHPFTIDSIPNPKDPYGVSKYLAEEYLQTIASRTSMVLTIIRPPLIYGPGVKGNFNSLISAVHHRVPLPFRGITANRRSFIALDNLTDFIIRCIKQKAADNQTFLASDGEDLSTAELLQRLGKAIGKPARLFWVPESILKGSGYLIKQKEIYQRVCKSLQVDIEKTRSIMNWNPSISIDEALRRTQKQQPK